MWKDEGMEKDPWYKGNKSKQRCSWYCWIDVRYNHKRQLRPLGRYWKHMCSQEDISIQSKYTWKRKSSRVAFNIG